MSVKKEKPMYPSTLNVVMNAVLGRESRVPAASVTGGPPDPRNAPGPYTTLSMGFGVNAVESQSEFEKIHEQFVRVRDKSGVPMIEIARKYWDNPEWAEFQRREIRERKK